MQNLLISLQNKLLTFGIILNDAYCLDEYGDISLSDLDLDLNLFKVFLEPSTFKQMQNIKFNIITLNSLEIFESGLGISIDIEILETLIEVITTQEDFVSLKELILKKAAYHF